MGTDKRDRQKFQRRARIDEAWLEYNSRKRRRRIALAVVILALVGGSIYGVVALAGDDEEVAADETGTTLAEDQEPCPEADGSSERITEFGAAPPSCLDPTKGYEAIVITSEGEFTIALDPISAPTTVNNFVYLARYHYFDGLGVCRIVEDFVIQMGDPGFESLDDERCKNGGPGYTFVDEPPLDENGVVANGYRVGEVAMANGGPNTNGSQFFIVTSEAGFAPQMPGSYSLFGKIIDGLDVVQAIGLLGENEIPTELVTIESIEILETDTPTRVRETTTTTVADSASTESSAVESSDPTTESTGPESTDTSAEG